MSNLREFFPKNMSDTAYLHAAPVNEQAGSCPSALVLSAVTTVDMGM